MNKKNFYETYWFMWLMLVFVAPVGIFLLYRYNRFDIDKRRIISVAFSALWIVAMISANISSKEEKKQMTEQKAKQKIEQKVAADKKIIATDKRKQEELNKPSKFKGITIGQEQKLKKYTMAEAKKNINKDGEFSDWKITKEGDLFTLLFSCTTKERNVSVSNKFVASLNWSGSDENFKLHKINSNPVILLDTKHIITLQTIAKDAVKANLKSPSTAKFPGAILGADNWKYGATFKDTGEGNVLYQVQSYVDAQNSFGAKIRNTFIVAIEMNWKTNKYTIKSVNLSE